MSRDDIKVKAHRWFMVTMAIIAFTALIIFGAATGFFIPNQRSDNLLVEASLPVIAASVFSLITGFLAGGEKGSLPQAALGGAINALANLGLLFWVLSAKDRHFVAIGGRALSAWLPVTTFVGALLGLCGAGVRKLLRKRSTREKRY